MVVWGPEHYKCFRASCGKAGWGRGAVTPREKEARYFTKPTQSLSTQQAEFLCLHFSLAHVPRVTYSPDEDRFVFEVLGPQGGLRGSMARSYSGAEPKTLAYRAKTEEPWMHWSWKPVRAMEPEPVVIVEDIVSAEKVGQAGFYRGCALLGTHIDLERAQEIKTVAGGARVIIALDKDATIKAINYYGKFGDFIPNLTVLALDRDLKDMGMADTWRLLEHATNSTSARGLTQQQERI